MTAAKLLNQEVEYHPWGATANADLLMNQSSYLLRNSKSSSLMQQISPYQTKKSIKISP